MKTKIVRILECLRCGYEWIPKVENPKQCPKCKRMDWDVKKEDKQVKGGEEKYGK